MRILNTWKAEYKNIALNFKNPNHFPKETLLKVCLEDNSIAKQQSRDAEDEDGISEDYKRT